jgi:hypothetical protein
MLDPHLDIGLGKAGPDCAVVELAPLPAHDVRLPAIRRPDFQPGSRPIDQVQGRQADLGPSHHGRSPICVRVPTRACLAREPDLASQKDLHIV